MDMKLCSNVPTVDFVDTWTFVTIFKSRHLDPNNWVLANGSIMIYQPLGHLLGPGSRVWCQGSTLFLCNLIFGPHIPGPVNLWDTYWVLGLGPRTQDPGPGLRTCSPITRILWKKIICPHWDLNLHPNAYCSYSMLLWECPNHTWTKQWICLNK